MKARIGLQREKRHDVVGAGKRPVSDETWRQPGGSHDPPGAHREATDDLLLRRLDHIHGGECRFSAASTVTVGPSPLSAAQNFDSRASGILPRFAHF